MDTQGIVRLFKAFNSKIVLQAIQTFDRNMIIVVSTAWVAAIVMVVFAMLAVSSSGAVKRDITAAAATEPALPQIINQSVSADELRPMVDRMQKRFPDIIFFLGGDGGLKLTTHDVGKFHTWLEALSYIDTISTQFRWRIKQMCIGTRCPGGESTPLTAEIAAERTAFSQ